MIVIVSVLVAAIVAFGIAMAVSGGKQEPAKPPEPVATVTADAAAVAPPPIDAAVVQAPAPDAGIAAVAPQIDAGVEIKKEAIAGQSREKRMGRLVVRAFPVLTVYVDNKKIHDTPVDMKLPVGKHKVRLVNSEFGKNEAINVTIEENKTETIERN